MRHKHRDVARAALAQHVKDADERTTGREHRVTEHDGRAVEVLG